MPIVIVKADIKADIETVDKEESEGLIEPLLIRESSLHRTCINNLVVDLAA